MTNFFDESLFLINLDYVNNTALWETFNLLNSLQRARKSILNLEYIIITPLIQHEKTERRTKRSRIFHAAAPGREKREKKKSSNYGSYIGALHLPVAARKRLNIGSRFCLFIACIYVDLILPPPSGHRAPRLLGVFVRARARPSSLARARIEVYGRLTLNLFSKPT